MDLFQNFKRERPASPALCEKYASAIPVFATAFAGLLTWEKGRYLRFVNYQSGTFEGVAAGLNFFWGDLADGVFNDRFLELARYQEAAQALEPLRFDECFGYALLPGLGGCRRTENLQKYKLREHIAFLTQAVWQECLRDRPGRRHVLDSLWAAGGDKAARTETHIGQGCFGLGLPIE